MVRHPAHEITMFLFVFLGRFRVEGNYGQQIFRTGEHVLFDHEPKLFVTVPVGIFTFIARAGAQYEIDYLVAKILWIANTGRVLYFLELVV